MSYVIAPIVEGHGDVQAVPVLLRRLVPYAKVARPVRCPRQQFLDHERLGYFWRIARANIESAGMVLALFDADADCAAELARGVSEIIASSRGSDSVVFRVAIVVRGFENWIIGGDPESPADDADAFRSAAERLREKHGRYRKTVDQPRLIATADLDLLRSRSRSFVHLHKVLQEVPEFGQ